MSQLPLSINFPVQEIRQFLRGYDLTDVRTAEQWAIDESTAAKIGDIYTFFTPCGLLSYSQPELQLQLENIALVFGRVAGCLMHQLVDDDKYEMGILERMLAARARHAREKEQVFYCLQAGFTGSLSAAVLSSTGSMHKWGNSGRRASARRGLPDPLAFFIKSLGVDPGLTDPDLLLPVSDIVMSLWLPAGLPSGSRQWSLAQHFKQLENTKMSGKSGEDAASDTGDKPGNLSASTENKPEDSAPAESFQSAGADNEEDENFDLASIGSALKDLVLPQTSSDSSPPLTKPGSPVGRTGSLPSQFEQADDAWELLKAKPKRSDYSPTNSVENYDMAPPDSEHDWQTPVAPAFEQPDESEISLSESVEPDVSFSYEADEPDLQAPTEFLSGDMTSESLFLSEAEEAAAESFRADESTIADEFTLPAQSEASSFVLADEPDLQAPTEFLSGDITAESLLTGESTIADEFTLPVQPEAANFVMADEPVSEAQAEFLSGDTDPESLFLTQEDSLDSGCMAETTLLVETELPQSENELEPVPEVQALSSDSADSARADLSAPAEGTDSSTVSAVVEDVQATEPDTASGGGPGLAEELVSPADTTLQTSTPAPESDGKGEGAAPPAGADTDEDDESSSRPHKKLSLQATLAKIEDQAGKAQVRLAEFKQLHEESCAADTNKSRQQAEHFKQSVKQKLEEALQSSENKLDYLGKETANKLKNLSAESENQIAGGLPQAITGLEQIAGEADVPAVVIDLRGAGDNFRSSSKHQLELVEQTQKSLLKGVLIEIAEKLDSWKGGQRQEFIDSFEHVLSMVEQHRISSLSALESCVHSLTEELKRERDLDLDRLSLLNSELSDNLEQVFRLAEMRLNRNFETALTEQILLWLAQCKDKLSRRSETLKFEALGQMEAHSQSVLSEFAPVIAPVQGAIDLISSTASQLKETIASEINDDLEKRLAALPENFQLKLNELSNFLGMRQEMEMSAEMSAESDSIQRVETICNSSLVLLQEAALVAENELSRQTDVIINSWESRVDDIRAVAAAEMGSELDKVKNHRRESMRRLQEKLSKISLVVQALQTQLMQ